MTEPVAPLESILREVAGLPPGRRSAALWEDQRRRWESGQQVPAEAYAAGLGDATDPDLLLDLLYGEYALRRKAGESPDPDEYARRSPDAASLRRQLALHDGLSAAEAAASTEETVDAFAPTVLPETQASEGEPLPERIGGYRVFSLLGRGGQGTVYRGVHPTLGRDVVIKVGPPDAGLRPDRLAEEGRVLAGLDHPGLIRVYDLGVDRGRPFLVMEYVAGRTLEQYARGRRVTPGEAARLVISLARALAYAHGRGVVHGDVKPANVLIDENGEARLIDFGLARVDHAWRAAEGEAGLAGTVEYMPPEQAACGPPGPRSDVFALGGVLYFLLTGRAPYAGRTPAEVLSRAARCDWDRRPLETVPGAARLKAICRRALESDPAERFSSAAALAEALERSLRPSRWRLLAAAAGVALAAAGVVWLATRERPEGARDRLEDVSQTPRLVVRVWQGERYADLADSLPLGVDEEVQLIADPPKGAHAALLIFDSAGRWRILADAGPRDGQPLRFPAKESESARLEPPAGTELALALGRRAGPITPSELTGVLDGLGPLSSLPGTSALWLSRHGVRSVAVGRNLGGPMEREDPEGKARGQLESLRSRLDERFDWFEGVAFGHR